MKALVTGNQGFVGRHLTAHLEAAGDEVIGVDLADGVDITDADSTTALVVSIAPDVVYHLAGWAEVGGSWKAPVAASVSLAERSRPTGGSAM